MRKVLISIIDAIKNFFITIFTSRIHIVGLIFIILFCVIFVRLFYLQVIQKDYYSENFTQKTEKTLYTEGARGNIYDCNGKLLAHNELSYSVTITDEIPSSDTKGEELNGIVEKTISIIEENGDSIVDNFNIELDSEGNLQFKEYPVTPHITFLCNVFGKSSLEELKSEGYDVYTAEQVFDYMCSDSRFDISSQYDIQTRLKICAVRYLLSINSYQKYISTAIAVDISDRTRAAITESKSQLIGVDLEENYKRVYDEGIALGSVLGYTGEISDSEIDEFNSSTETYTEYSLGNIVGKAGVEKSYDEYLRGTQGVETMFVDAKGNIMETIETTPSSSGNDLYLTIDANMQKAAYSLLEQEIAGILASKLVDYDYEPEANAEVIYVPIKDVYYKLLTNVLNTNNFKSEDASEREKSVYSRFTAYKQNVLNDLQAELNNPAPTSVGELSSEYNEYMYELYDCLGTLSILDKDAMDLNNIVYTNWENEISSLREFIMGAISENWINASTLGITSRYADSSTIYAAVIEKLLEGIEDDTDFEKLIYYYMVHNNEISGEEICLILYDQDRISNENGLKESLEAGEIQAFSYCYIQITNLVITPDMIGLDPCSGSLVVTDSKTGKVKALVSYPSYDNNRLSGSIDSEYWNYINNNSSSPLFNKATQSLIAPGSTFKPLSAICGLKNNVINTYDTIYDEVTFTQVDPSPKCWISNTNGSHGDENLSDALKDSCNYYFYTVGYDLGISSENGAYSSSLGLEKLEGTGLEVGLAAKSGVEIEETDPNFSTTDSVRTAIGQGKNAFAAVQLARYVNTVAQKGRNYQLSIVDKVINKQGATIKKVEPYLANTVELYDEGWNAIHDGMHRVCTEGTASGVFYDSFISVAGKTGTAQENKYRSNHATFIGFAPYEDPELSFACIIRNGDSSSYPSEVCKSLLKYYYGQLSYEEIMNGVANSIIAERSLE